ncbi:MAG: BACON domain-containing protein [Alistipes sp.]
MLLSLFALAFTGCTEDKVEYTSFDVSGDSYTFDGGGVQTYKIEVQSPMDGWKYTVEGDWVTIVAKDATSLTIGAQINMLPTERSGKVVFTAGTQTLRVVVRQLPISESCYRTVDDLETLAMSPGGVYIGGFRKGLGEDKAFYYTPVVIEMATGKRTEFEKMSKPYMVRAITDQGDMIYNNDLACYIQKLDGTITSPTVVAGYTNPVISSVSVGAGGVMVGYCKKGRVFSGVKWANMESVGEILESPTTNSWGDPLKSGVLARGCSADGSIIYGTEWDKRSPVYWTADGTVHHAGADLLKRETGIITNPNTGKDQEVKFTNFATLPADVNNMSPNGKYIAFAYNKTTIANKIATRNYYAVLFDIETGESTVVEQYDDATGITVLDDGTLAIGMPYGAVRSGAIYDSKSKTTMSTTQWIKQKYNLIITEDYPIYKMATDEKTVLLARPLPNGVTLTYRFAYIFNEKH